MDWTALSLSLHLGLWTLALLLPLSILGGRWLAWHSFRGKSLLEAALALPLVLPPTVLGFYLLQVSGNAAPLGRLWQNLFGTPLAFSFEGLVFASLVANIPFALQPVQQAFAAIPRDLREAADCCGLPAWRRFCLIELPLAWPGLLTGAVLTFAHTLGEFGVVLMVGGSIPGETRTIAIAIYDRVQAFDESGAGLMAATLLLLSLAAIAVTTALSKRALHRHD